MKIALVNVPDEWLSGKGFSIPLGLAYVAAAVRETGAEVRVFDLGCSRESVLRYYLKSDRELLGQLSAYAPDFIGMTCTTSNRINLNFWARQFKATIPKARIIVGGPHPFFIPESYLKTAPDVDVIILGEGEATVVDYLAAVATGQDLRTVAGIGFREAGGGIVVNPLRPVIENLDKIPFPARDLFPLENYDMSFGTISGKIAPLITSRGCGSRCKFCCTTRYWQKVRFRSAENVVDEIEHILKRFPFVDNFVFYDDTFTSWKKHTVGVCKEIIRRGIKINWGCWSRTDVIGDEMLELLRETGCTTLSFGIESGNDLMLQTLRKNSTVQNNIRALTLPRKYGISTRGTMIGGMPEEQFGWAIDSLLFMTRPELNYKNLQISLQTFLFPGTPWEQWFREKHPDFSWEAIPERFKAGSILDSHGNVTMPCFRWKGIPYALLYLFRKLIKYKFVRKMVASRHVTSLIRRLAYAIPVQNPSSIYD